LETKVDVLLDETEVNGSSSGHEVELLKIIEEDGLQAIYYDSESYPYYIKHTDLGQITNARLLQ